jgi:hypothetical protein
MEPGGAPSLEGYDIELGGAPGGAVTQSARDDYVALLDRLKTFGGVVLAVVIDLLFVGAWVLMHQWFDLLIHYLSSPSVGLNSIATIVLECIFTASTLAIVVVYVVADFVSSVRRIWKKVG